MENEKNLWNTKANEITVADQLKVTAMTAMLMVVVPVAVTAVSGKVRSILANRKTEKSAELEVVA